ncbi:IS3 family transposase [Sporosarcina sp. GW1-11]|uniref:IS3 family transposase n=1 Tax=Sporosarcina sp. GW1-11 TaxID=2899126 RepID=UPI00294C7480|nr:IS3 family transposase [Sporosarcina sp. GW1-11]MDV6379514.1 IS3 family transposase [Sporosarcina sp. GW1-11]
MNEKAEAYYFIETYRATYPVSFLAKAAGVSRSGYYKWRTQGARPTREERDKPLLIQMISLYQTHGGNLGNERFKDALYEKYHVIVSVKRVRRMRERYHMPLKTKRRRPRKNGQQPHGHIKNLLNRNFNAIKPGIKFCMDITYLEIKKPEKDFLYLCSIMDLYNNEIVAYSIGEYQDKELVNQALDRLAERGYKKGALLHSDQGTQFTNFGYCSQLKKMKLTQSMSRRGNCWDNACIESFFSKLKTEMPGFTQPETAEEMKQAVADYITYYNHVRPQLKLKKSPVSHRLEQVA